MIEINEIEAALTHIRDIREMLKREGVTLYETQYGMGWSIDEKNGCGMVAYQYTITPPPHQESNHD